jgi:hypothetical protein
MHILPTGEENFKLSNLKQAINLFLYSYWQQHFALFVMSSTYLFRGQFHSATHTLVIGNSAAFILEFCGEKNIKRISFLHMQKVKIKENVAQLNNLDIID